MSDNIAKILEENLSVPSTTPVKPAPRQLYGQRDTDALYVDLRRILDRAYDQSAKGKGAERHAVGPVGDRPWDEQPILQIGRMVGTGYAAGQVQKKAQEACGMVSSKNFEAAKAEVLGVIVYAASLYRLIEDMEKVK